MGEVAHDAVVSAAQAESALGRNLATELDDDLWEPVDDDQRAEEEQSVGRGVHPQSADMDYSLLCWSPDPTDVKHSPDWINCVSAMLPLLWKFTSYGKSTRSTL